MIPQALRLASCFFFSFLQDASATGVLRCLKHSSWLHLQIEGTCSPAGGGGGEEEEGSAVLNILGAGEAYGISSGCC